MRAVRRVFRLVTGLLFLPAMYILWSPALAFGALSPRHRASLQARCLRAVARGLIWIMGVRVKTVGDVPRPPFFLVSNHLSYIDILVIGSQAECFFVSKAEVARWPVIGLMVQLVGTRFVDRARKGDLARVMEEVKTLIAHGQGVVFFPEGTSSGGRNVLPFKSSLFEAAVQAQCPVRCASLSYQTHPGSPSAETAVCWWGDVTFVGHLMQLLGLPRVEARVAFAPQALAGGERKELAARAHETVQSLFVPCGVGAEGAPC
jgi:1-acyl-sn-glycerol-3-phosphate acyltransferase